MLGTLVGAAWIVGAKHPERTPYVRVTTERVARVANTATITTAALLMTPAEWVMPRLIASCVPSPGRTLRECGSG
jgi:hypothetical protein